MKLEAAEALARELMARHGLRPAWSFAFDRSLRRFGVCRFRSRTISLSRRLTKLNEEAEVCDTILHEIAHALVGPGHGHGPVWRAKAREIGAKPERCYSRASVVVPFSPLVAVCPGCAKRYPRFRRPARGRRYSCPRCSGGRFNEAFELRFRPRTAEERKAA